MHSLKNRIAIVVMGVILLITMIIILVFYLQAKPVVLKNTESEAKRDIAAAEAIIDLKCPGDWQAREGILYKGQVEVTNNYVLVDSVKDLSGASCSIYLNNVCVSTTVREGECEIRAVDRPIPKEVRSKVIVAGQNYLGQTEETSGAGYAAYKPLINGDGQVIGALYIGTEGDLYNGIVYGSMRTIGITGLILAALMALIVRFFIVGKFDKAKPRREADAKIWKSPAPEQLHKSSDNENSSKNNDVLEMLDALLDTQQELPKGLNALTLKEIYLFLLENAGDEVTVKDVSKSISLSTVTVRRYLDYMEECGMVDVEQEYGSVGRPLRIYRLKD